jgi:P-loop containing NTP hydrolase pore-1/C-terminal domain on Strawberry notch homologue
MQKALPKNLQAFVDYVRISLQKKVKHNKTSIEKVAKQFSIIDKTEVKELTELAIVLEARRIVNDATLNTQEKFNTIVELYNGQVNLSHRTSQSMLLQQYSTPAPIAFIAGIFCGLDTLENNNGKAFEPSAGNGLLTIAGNPKCILVNEIDYARSRNLASQPYINVWRTDATKPFNTIQKTFDAVITNPPFGKLDTKVKYEQFEFNTLDHVMALRALDTMKDDGKASIIIGGHTEWDEQGRIQAGKNRIFFNYLYRHYNVLDVIPINGQKLYSRQGTSFNTRLILIDGRKKEPNGVAPLYNATTDVEVFTFENLYERVMIQTQIKQTQLEREANDLLEMMSEELGMPYQPSSTACIVLNTQVPDSMGFETHAALQEIRKEVGGDIDNFVRHRLNYSNRTELCKALSAEQTDAVAVAIYNIEARGQGMIIGDQTGIGKGRIAASMIRYAVTQGLKPIFITEKANLFSDIYRDLKAIGCGHYKPFIVNGKESKTDIKDEDGNIIYQALPANDQAKIFSSREIPKQFDFVVGTYSQFNSPDKKPEKPLFLNAIAENNIMIMDEAHNSSGSSNTGEYLQNVVANAKGVVFLSATFAKRPDNMPIYAMKTSIADCNMTKDELVEAINKGGVALQEVLASQLVAEGQMMRRERSFEGVEVNYITLEEREQEHKAIADNITEIVRDIIAFQANHIDTQVKELDKIAAAEGKEVGVREGTSQAGVDNQPYFSKVFQVVNQMLFSIKADAVAERALMRLREGKKPIIAFASTMGSFIEQMETKDGRPVGDGDTINTDFSEVLKRGLDSVMRYTEKDINGEPIYKNFEITEMPMDAQLEYKRITSTIKKVSTGITISPIDIIIQKIQNAGYSVAEVTGRKYELQINTTTNQGLILSRKKLNTNDAFRQFNNNEVDVLMINQSGSTGASAHAITTAKVAQDQVKTRVMIVLQAELDINTEVQKRGRINRTGQILKPIYDYVNSAIPAEKRLMMMLQKKLKSLDANTTSNQKQSTKILDVPDFLNKYGDKIVKEYLLENLEINTLLGDPLKLAKSDSEQNEDVIEDAAHRVSGRVAVLSTKMQSDFYTEIAERYTDYIEYLRQTGEYDLEVEAMNLETETIDTRIVKMGKGGDSAFGEDSILETVKANVLKKPFTKIELANLLKESLGDKDALTIKNETIENYKDFFGAAVRKEMADIKEKYITLNEEIHTDKKLLKIKETHGEKAYQLAIGKAQVELIEAENLSINYIEKTYGNRNTYMNRLFHFFTIGKKLMYPVESFNAGQELVMAVFLGFVIDAKKKNPYAPSALKLRFALANSNKYLAIPASYSDDITSIIGASMDVAKVSDAEMLEEWDSFTKKNIVDRKVRHIITGNLLQAFSDFKGKLVSYTTMDGQTKKGILMPEHWQNNETNKQERVVVPIIKALPLIKSLQNGTAINSTNGMSIFKQYSSFKIYLPSSRQKAGHIYLDPNVLEHVLGKNFEKVSDKMVANVAEENIEAFLNVLQQNHSMSVTIPFSMMNVILNQTMPMSTRKKIVLPPLESNQPQAINNLLELEAEALMLELELT